jgi:hypothetical protein
MATWIVLTDDWELRGNGTGRVEDLQRAPALRLMDVYDGLGIKSTFNLEVMQQLAFEKYADADEFIRAGRDAWRDTVRTMLARNFDVQLHLHPQWVNAERIDGWWKLDRRWNIADYPESEIANMVEMAIAYLAPLIAPHKVASFRGGSWGLGPPSRPIISILAKHGIKLDVTVVNGSYIDGSAIKLDYRTLDSPYLAYTPDIDDVRRFPRSPQGAAPIVEIPTQSVSGRDLVKRVARDLTTRPTLELISWAAEKGFSKFKRRFGRAPATARAASAPAPDFVIKDPFGLDSGRSSTDYIVDLSAGYAPVLYKIMADICIDRANKAERPLAVLVFENHTKDLQKPSDFTRIEGLIGHIRSKHPGVQFKTLAEVADCLDRVVC